MLLAPAGHNILTIQDAMKVYQELLPARSHSFQLGRSLKLSLHEVESIHSNFSSPDNRLLHIINAFLKQVDRRPTWRFIAEALRNPLVSLPELARRVEAAHLPDTTAPPNVSEISGMLLSA